jgi:hypothetical protein
MNYLIHQWQRFRLWLLLRHIPPDEREEIVKEAKLIVALEQYSRTLRRMR